MFKELKLLLCLCILVIGFISISADTKIFLSVGDSYRTETISLDDDQHLYVKGSFEEGFKMPKDSNNRLFLTVIYIADKDGFKAKYVLVRNKYHEHAVVLSPFTLKSAAG